MEEEQKFAQDEELAQDFSFWSLLKFTGPSIFTFVFIAVYQMVDGLFIERYVGDLAISAINLYYPVISLFIAVGIMIGTGGNAVIVRKVGEGKRKEAGQTFSRVIIFTILSGILITVVCLTFADPIMRLCGATDGNIEYLRPYYMLLSAFSITILLQSELGILIIGEGRTVTAAIVIMIGGVLNCVLDYYFMAHLKWGIQGAAAATVIGYCSTIIYAIWFYILAKKSSYKLEFAKPDLKEIGVICFNGSSDMVSNLAGGVSVLFMNHLAHDCYGEVGVSALSVITYLQFLIEAVFMGFTTAVEPVFSYHYGSGNIPMRKKVYKYSVIWSFVLGAVLIVVLYFLRGVIIGIYFKPDTEFYRISLLGYMISLPAALFTGYNTFGSGLFTAFSNGVISGFLSLVRTFFVLILCLFALTALFGGYGLWSAWPAAEVVSFIITAIFLYKYRGRYKYA
ncbi:MAG: polysaccharide biosynthesis C-terminal domain-containing protein [Lachnospiraceae bacterium]|nr:polysaccharide biosynthesis C-terminal domain-containing protein [Lachnospiraceae bacterium]